MSTETEPGQENTAQFNNAPDLGPLGSRRVEATEEERRQELEHNGTLRERDIDKAVYMAHESVGAEERLSEARGNLELARAREQQTRTELDEGKGEGALDSHIDAFDRRFRAQDRLDRAEDAVYRAQQRGSAEYNRDRDAEQAAEDKRRAA